MQAVHSRVEPLFAWLLRVKKLHESAMSLVHPAREKWKLPVNQLAASLTACHATTSLHFESRDNTDRRKNRN
jgi:hypothetical protein